MCTFNGLFNGKLAFVSNLIFMKSLPHSPSLSPFTVLISFLIPCQSFVFFSGTFLFSSVESKSNNYSHFFLQRSCTQYVDLLHQLPDTKDLHCKYFLNHRFFLLWCIQCNKYQCFCTTFCLCLVSLNQKLQY